MITNGRITGKLMDNGVLKAMQEKALQEAKQKRLEMEQRNSEFIESIRVNAKAQGVHIKTSHAEDLSKYTYRQNMAHDDEGR